MEILFIKVRYSNRRHENPLLGEMRAAAIRFEVEYIFAPSNKYYDQVFSNAKFIKFAELTSLHQDPRY